MLARRHPARSLAAATATLLAVLGAPPAAAQPRATHAIIAQGAVDGVTRALMDASPTPGESLVARVVESDVFLARATGNQVTVTTRFLGEASRDGLAGALARDVFGDPVLLAIVLHRAGFDGPAGLAELHDRVMLRLAIEARHLASVQAAYQALQAVLSTGRFHTAVPEGFQVMAAARIRTAEAAYLQAAESYRLLLLDQPRYFAMAPVPAELVRAVGEITAALRGPLPTEDAWWGARIRSALESFPPSGAALPR